MEELGVSVWGRQGWSYGSGIVELAGLDELGNFLQRWIRGLWALEVQDGGERGC